MTMPISYWTTPPSRMATKTLKNVTASAEAARVSEVVSMFSIYCSLSINGGISLHMEAPVSPQSLKGRPVSFMTVPESELLKKSTLLTESPTPSYP